MAGIARPVQNPNAKPANPFGRAIYWQYQHAWAPLLLIWLAWVFADSATAVHAILAAAAVVIGVELQVGDTIHIRGPHRITADPRRGAYRDDRPALVYRGTTRCPLELTRDG